MSAWVAIPDVDVLIAGFRETYSGSPDLDGPDDGTEPDTWIAADFDHILNTYGIGGRMSARVAVPDVDVLIYHFRNKNGVPPADCQTETPTSP